MKNRFLWLLILGVALFTACSDDDDKPLIAPSDLNTTFGEGETTLNMTYGGAALIGKQVKFSTTNSKTATLTLTDVIPGQAETTIDDIQLVEDNDKYTFEGTTSISRSTASQGSIAYNGSVKKGELTLNLTVTMPDSQGWAKTYQLGDYTTIADGQNLVVATGAGYVNYVITNDGKEDDSQGQLYKSMLSLMLPQVLQSVTLELDGNVRANYVTGNDIQFEMDWIFSFLGPTKVPSEEVFTALIPTEGWIQSPKNLAYWFEKDGRLYLKLDIPAIIAQAGGSAGDATISTIINTILNENVATIKALLEGVLPGISEISDATFTMLLDWVKNGIPLNIKATGGHTYIYLDRSAFDTIMVDNETSKEDYEYGQKADLMKLMTLLIQAELIPEEYNGIIFLVAGMCQNWPNTSSFDLGLDLIAQ